ncbi:MAG TPA: RNA polymerase sigma factor, partial [Methylomirabilota bacterium]|nr:RNA polymerase sigma factor [Methylomirabilota bacterium]
MNRTDDARLIHRCLQGDRDAFAALVERYQVLVCSLAYSTCGSLSRSEDIAQETFLAAWRNLPRLRQPESFKSWLCGIARNLSHDERRRAARNPTDAAEPWPGTVEPADPAPQPGEAAMSHEEEALLWRTLQRLPPNYRESLILFYREGRS